MNEAAGYDVPSYGFNLTLMGAEIIADGQLGGALQVKPDINGYATGDAAHGFFLCLLPLALDSIRAIFVENRDHLACHHIAC